MTNFLRTSLNRSGTRRPGNRGACVLAAVAVVASIAALSGCGMRVIDTNSGQPPTSTAPATAPTESTTEPPASTDPTTMPSRSDFAGSVGQTLSCTSEPLEVSAIGVIVELTGECGDVTISSSGAVVLAESIDSLTITGVGNTVLVNSVDLLGVTGDANVVLWAEGAPAIDDSGVSNVLTRDRS